MKHYCGHDWQCYVFYVSLPASMLIGDVAEEKNLRIILGLEPFFNRRSFIQNFIN